MRLATAASIAALALSSAALAQVTGAPLEQKPGQEENAASPSDNVSGLNDTTPAEPTTNDTAPAEGNNVTAEPPGKPSA